MSDAWRTAVYNNTTTKMQLNTIRIKQRFNIVFLLLVTQMAQVLVCNVALENNRQFDRPMSRQSDASSSQHCVCQSARTIAAIFHHEPAAYLIGHGAQGEGGNDGYEQSDSPSS